jgi:hypothetical protein
MLHTYLRSLDTLFRITFDTQFNTGNSGLQYKILYDIIDKPR